VNVTSVYPYTGSRDAYIFYTVDLHFNAPMNEASTESAFLLMRQGAGAVPGAFLWASDRRSFSFRPLVALEPGTLYFVTISTRAQSESGQALKAPFSSFFRTQFGLGLKAPVSTVSRTH